MNKTTMSAAACLLMLGVLALPAAADTSPLGGLTGGRVNLPVPSLSGGGAPAAGAVRAAGTATSSPTGGTASGRSDPGRLDLFLVNSGPTTLFFDAGLPCVPKFLPAQASLTRGTSERGDSLAGGVGTQWSFVSDRSFTVPANPNAIVLKEWWSSGPGTCPGQTIDQPVNWIVTCAGPTCGAATLTTLQTFFVPGGTTTPTLFNLHAGPAMPVSVGVGDTITLNEGCPGFPELFWNAPLDQGLSSMDILTS